MKPKFFTEDDLKTDIQTLISNSFTEKEIRMLLIQFKCIHFICSRIFTSLFGATITYFSTDLLVDIQFTLFDHIIFFVCITLMDKFVFARAHISLFKELYDDSGIIIQILKDKKVAKKN